MIDVEREYLMGLYEVQDWIFERFGRRFSRSTIYRWIGRGARGRKLDIVRVGGLLYTSREALTRFFADGSDAVGGMPPFGRAATAATRRAGEVFG